jgi:hypothetical protein
MGARSDAIRREFGRRQACYANEAGSFAFGSRASNPWPGIHGSMGTKLDNQWARSWFGLIQEYSMMLFAQFELARKAAGCA